jgi:hypothetical protein
MGRRWLSLAGALLTGYRDLRLEFWTLVNCPRLGLRPWLLLVLRVLGSTFQNSRWLHAGLCFLQEPKGSSIMHQSLQGVG